VFLASLTDAGLRDCKATIEAIIDPGEDDVRIYPLPREGQAWRLGTPVLPEGIQYTALPGTWPLFLHPESLTAATERHQHLPASPRPEIRNPMADVIQTGQRRGIMVIGR
jgi:hypothetical protein